MGSERSFYLHYDEPADDEENCSNNIGRALILENISDNENDSISSASISTNCSDMSEDETTDNIRYMLTNARSISPKIISLIRNFDEFKIDISIVTETSLADNGSLVSDLSELENGTNLRVIYKNQPVKPNSRRRTAGGSVAIIYNKNTASLKEQKINGNKFEMVCARGKIGNVDRSIVVLGIYLEPKVNAASLAEIREKINDIILIEKAATKDPIFLIGGDLNKKDISPAMEDYVDMYELQHGPTRLAEKLDITYTNVADTKTSVHLPLQTESGINSDHNCVFSVLSLPKKKRFTWTKKRIRTRNSKGDIMFGKLLREVDWNEFYANTKTSSEMVDRLHQDLESWMDKCYPFKTVRRRSNEATWITNGIRRKIRMRMAVFRREGRSQKWLKLDKQIKKMIK